MIKYFYLIIILFFSCDNPLTNTETQDCITDLGGFYDDCGICSGGLTNHIPNSSKDCNGDCFGGAALDQCGICNGNNYTCDSLSNYYCDLNAGEFWDDCNSCIGIDDIENEFMDDCGSCFEDQSEFDQSENDLMDICGICNGNNTSCDYGLMTMPDLKFSQIKLWNNDLCYGNPYYVMNNYICLENEGSCFSYTIDFEPDYEYGIFVFTQTIQFTNDTEVELNGQWLLNTEDCPGLYLDYNNANYEDGCYNEIDIQNSYNDCTSNISLCENNILSLLIKDDVNQICSKETLNSTINENRQLINITSDIYSLLPFHIRNIVKYINQYSSI